MAGHSVEGRRLVVLADGHLDFHFGKTAMGIIRYRPHDVVAVIESGLAGTTTQQAVGLGGDIPIVATLEEALGHGPDALLIGVATRGGRIPPEWRPMLLEAIDRRLDVICGLHEFLGDDVELSDAAATTGTRLIDVRKPPAELAVAEATPHRTGCTVITMVGADCAVGKMSVALDIQAEARRQHIDMGFVATGQTGMMISGTGIPVDRIIGDFMSGAVEREVLTAAERHDIVLVEGQGSLLHPAYSGVTLSLLHGSQPDAMVLTVMPSRKTLGDYQVEIPPALELVEMHEAAAAWIKPAPVIAVAVNSLGLDDEQSRHAIAGIQVETGLPAEDTFRNGARLLVKAVQQFHEQRTREQLTGRRW